MEYLKVWTSFREVIAALNDAEKGRLFDAMLQYAETGEEPHDFRGNERFLWPVAKLDIDRTAQKCETLRANASKGGTAKSRNQQNVANNSKDCQAVADCSNDHQTEAEAAYNIKKSNIKKDKEKENNNMCRRFTPPTLEEVKAYCQERNNKVDPEKWIDFYASKGWKVGNQPMKDWKACVRTWEKGNNYGGSSGKGSGKPDWTHNYTQRDCSGRQEELMANFVRQLGQEDGTGLAAAEN